MKVLVNYSRYLWKLRHLVRQSGSILDQIYQIFICIYLSNYSTDWFDVWLKWKDSLSRTNFITITKRSGLPILDLFWIKIFFCLYFRNYLTDWFDVWLKWKYSLSRTNFILLLTDPDFQSGSMLDQNILLLISLELLNGLAWCLTQMRALLE